MQYNITIIFPNSGSRNEVRKRVVNEFMEEEPGTGRGEDSTRYHYYVEQLSNGDRIYLSRPAVRRWGFDFVIHVENVDFNRGNGRCRDRPKHDDIYHDLEMKKRNEPREYRRLLSLIRRVHECNEVPVRRIRGLRFATGLPVDLLLGVIKWFFIEQDIRYWNYSGRNEFVHGIPDFD